VDLPTGKEKAVIEQPQGQIPELPAGPAAHWAEVLMTLATARQVAGPTVGLRQSNCRASRAAVKLAGEESTSARSKTLLQLTLMQGSAQA
jgi:hypothetical protein